MYINNFFLGSPANKYKWILLALLIKFSMLVFNVYKGAGSDAKSYYVVSGDTPSYIEPIENLISYGSYKPDFRMPGYGSIYFLLRQFLGQHSSFYGLVFLQCILAAVSVYYLALIAQMLFKKKRYFFITFWLMAISIFSNYFDIFILTDSLGCSILIFSTYYFVMGLKSPSNKIFAISGLLFAIAIFLRPVILPIFILAAVFILIRAIKKQVKVQVIFYFIGTFIIIDSLWVIRNYTIKDKFIPLMSSSFYPHQENSFLKPTFAFVQSWGGSILYWDPTAEITWFGVYIPSNYNKAEALNNPVSIPDDIYTSEFNFDSLLLLKKELTILYRRSSDNYHEHQVLERKVIRKLDRYTESVKHEKKYLYYIKAPIRILIHFIQHGAGSVSGTSGIIYFYKLFYVFFYYMVIGGFLLGAILLYRDWFNFKSVSFVLAIPVYIILVHSLILRMPEARYLVPAWPFMILITSYFIVKCFEKKRILFSKP